MTQHRAFHRRQFLTLLGGAAGWAAAAAAAGPALAAANPYRAYAQGLVAHPPAGVSIRPELESYLVALTNAERKRNGRAPLEASTAFLIPARAQAIDMLLTDTVGHFSAQGYGMATRYDAFASDEVSYPARGENAARDRQPGGVDKAKAARLFQQWIDSPHHHQNMLDGSYRKVSVGAIAKGNHLYAIQFFWVDGAKTSCNLPGFC